MNRAPAAAVVAGAAAAVVLITAALLSGDKVPQPSVGGRRTRVDWPDGGPPARVKCLWSVALASPSALALYGLDAGRRLDAGRAESQYVRARVCGEPLDGGGPRLPEGMTGLEVTYEEVDFDGGPQLLAVLQGEPEWPCACSTGADCEEVGPDGGWAPARLGLTLGEGRWRGNGCHRKTCVELYGGPSGWPQECPER